MAPDPQRGRSPYQIEVTENVFIGREAERVRGNLEAFDVAGVGIALDGFGTGYASLTHLKRYPVSTLKVDRSFVRDIESDREDAAIVRAVIALGRSLGKVVVAEGVETEAQAAFLGAEGCPLAQGSLMPRRCPQVVSRERPALTCDR